MWVCGIVWRWGDIMYVSVHVCMYVCMYVCVHAGVFLVVNKECAFEHGVMRG